MQAKISLTLGGGFERTFEEAWGLDEYIDISEPTVFIGCYGLPDFYNIWRHKGKKYIFWCGSDIRHLQNGYWLDENGDIRIDNKDIAKWINKYCENWVENKPEHDALKKLGIKSNICPSYLGDVNEIKPSYKPGNRFYASVSGNDFELYGWNEIIKIAKRHPLLEFHLYGNTVRFEGGKNVIVHSRVSKEQMNEEIKDMQGCIRLIPMEGFSEIVAKSVLMEQWPISIIPYPYTISPEFIASVPKEPNKAGREYYLKTLNNYPWVYEN